MNLLLKLLITAAFFNALSWIILIPVWQYPDEQAHFAQVQDFAEIGRVPVVSFDTSSEIALSEKILGTERDQFGNNKFVYHPEYKTEYSSNLFGPWEKVITNLPKESRQTFVKKEATQNPPLYYLLGANTYKLFNSGDLIERVYAIRFLSLIFFLLTIAIIYKIGQLIFSKSKIAPFVLCILVSFKPMFVFSNTGVIPDSLTNILFSLMLLFSLKILISGLKITFIVPIILTLILGVYTRQQFIASIPVIAFPVVYHIVKNRKYFLKGIIAFISILIFFIFANTVGTTLLFFNNFRFPETTQLNFRPLFSLDFLKYLIQFVRHFIAETLPWYWGVYKWLSLTIPHINYQIINRFILLGLVGVILNLASHLRKRFTKSHLILVYLIWGTIIYVLIFAVWDYIFINYSGFSFGFQGRYFFPLIAFHMAILLIGSIHISNIIFRKFSKYFLLFIIFLMISFNNISLAYVASSYYSIDSFSRFVAEVSQYKPIIFKGDIILVILFSALILQSLLLFKFAKFLKSQNNYIIEI